MYHRLPVWERSHRGLVRRFAKPLSGVTCSEGSNPSLSATLLRRHYACAGRGGPATLNCQSCRRPVPVTRAPVAQWIERQVADLKVVSSSLAGRANP